MNFFHNLLSFCVTIGVVVTVHELGHYLAARWCGIAVDIFSFGFGRRIIGWRDRHGTVWQIAWIPLGGYVKFHDVTEGSLLARIITVAAGPFANFVLGIAVSILILITAGLPSDRPVVGSVQPNSAAAHAGLLPHDRIAKIDGVSITSFDQLRSIVQKRPGQTMSFTVERDGIEDQLPITIEPSGIIGVQPTSEPMQVGSALVDGPRMTWLLTKDTVVGLFHIKSVSELTGPVGLAQISGKAAQDGWTIWLFWIVVLSINLGVFNLIPLPVLDGGRLVYHAFEAFGRPLSQRVQLIGVATSALLLVVLLVVITWHDIARLLIGS